MRNKNLYSLLLVYGDALWNQLQWGCDYRDLLVRRDKGTTGKSHTHLWFLCVHEHENFRGFLYIKCIRFTKHCNATNLCLNAILFSWLTKKDGKKTNLKKCFVLFMLKFFCIQICITFFFAPINICKHFAVRYT